MKHLYRSKLNKKIAGVCGGFSEYFELDPALVRLVWLAAILLGGSGILIYLACWLIMPINPNPTPVEPILRPLTRSVSNKIIAGVCGGLGDYFQMDPVLVRITFLILTVCIGWGILFYIILWISVPKAVLNTHVKTED